MMDYRTALNIIGNDGRMIAYRPEWRPLVGSINGAILLGQLLYWWKKNGDRAFYKFKEPCDNPLYRVGDSWCEELGFSKAEFDLAWKYVEKAGFAYKKINMERITFYLIHEENLGKSIISLYGQNQQVTRNNLDYLRKSGNSLYVNQETVPSKSGNSLYVNPDTGFSYKEHRLLTEITTDISISPQTPKGAEGGKQQAQLLMDAEQKKKKTNTDEALIAECALKGVPVGLLVDYLQYRRNIKHPIKTAQGLQAQINILAELGDVEAMHAALANTKDNEYRKIVPKAPVEPSTPSAAMVVTASAHGLTNGTVEAEMKLMIQHYKVKGFTIWNYDAAFSRWLENKARFEAGRSANSKGFSSWKDTSWMDDVDSGLFGVSESEWRNA